jgi:anti-sigma-K factor RskA
MRLSDPRLADHLAASYVLGTLGPGARRRFAQVLRSRADLRLAVAQWEGRLGQLGHSVPAAEPSREVWRAIEQRTRRAHFRPGTAQSGRWWPIAGWGLGGIVGGVLAVVALLATTPAVFFTADQVAMRTGERLPQSYVGLLTDAQGDGKLLVSSLRHGRTMSIKVIGPIAAPAQGRLVLWAVPGDAPPFVLGDVPASGSAVSTLPDTSEKLLSNVRKLAVSVETAAAPAQPGTVVLSGNCAKLW